MIKKIKRLMQRRLAKVVVALIIPVLFLIVGFLTISDYGTTTDEPLHFRRGEAYFHYFLTGKKDYSDLTVRNIYQTDYYGNYEYWMKNDGGHPPLSDILSSLTVDIFYKGLGILGNIDAHHSIIIILSAICILSVYLFASEAYGRLVGLIAALSLSLYPFFLVASHNKIKAGPETAFFTLTVWTLWKGLKDRKWKWILLSSLYCGFALGTKFNIVFLPFIIFPWYLTLLVSRFIRKEKLFSFSFLVSLFLYPIVSLLILYVSWPWLWPAPFHRLLEVVGFYKDVGTVSSQGWGILVLKRAIFRTPTLILFLSIIGIGYALTHFRKEKNKTSLLVFLWLLVPILRGIAPGMTVYGSIHRMAEYIPPLSILAGIGARTLFLKLSSLLRRRLLMEKVSSRCLSAIIIFLFFIPHLFILVNLHPNEDLYFNFLIGGIKGAQKKGMIFSYMTIGNTFLQGAKWLNEHAEKNAACDVDGLIGNVQPQALRADINKGRFFSDLEKKGEYLLFAYENGRINPYTAGLFPAAYLMPIHQIKAQDVPIFNIYKNDEAHTYPGMAHYARLDLKPQWSINVNRTIEIDLKRKVVPAKIESVFSDKSCSRLGNGFIVFSSDHENWRRDAWNLSDEPGRYYRPGSSLHLINPPQITRFFQVQINANKKNNCYQKIKDIKIWALTDFINLVSPINIYQPGKYALVSQQKGFSGGFILNGKEVKINPEPHILENGWLIYNEGINLSSDVYRINRYSQKLNGLWLINISDFSAEEKLNSLERARKL